MSASLVVMANTLRAAAPAKNDVPGDYGELVRNAVAQISQDLPIVRMVDISVTPGVATYTLPPDFVLFIALTGMVTASGGSVLVGGSQLVAIAPGYQEDVRVEGDQLIIYPTPQYTAVRSLRYGACHVLDESFMYPRLSDNGVRIALLYARYLVLMEQANTMSDGWMYQIGDEKVDKKGQGAAMQQQAQAVLQQYKNAVGGLKGYGIRFKYIGDVDVV